MTAPASFKTGSLSFIEVLATSIALIGPSMTPVLIAPYMYANAGNGTWLAYVFGGVMLIFVALNINQFARRSTGAGSMYEYAAENLGPALGALSGWALLWAYVFVAAAVLGAMALFVSLLLARAGVQPNATLYVVIAIAIAAVCWQAAYRGVQVSAILMLVLEAISVGIILTLVGIVLFRHGPSIDTTQLTIKGGFPSWGLAIMTAVFSFVGFESATAFGAEASRPLVTIPRAVIGSVVLASLFFILTTYAEIVGLQHSAKPLDQLDSPLGVIAAILNAGYLQVPILIGALCSAFSVCLACVTTAGRIAYAMARNGVLPEILGKIEPKHDTPHVAVTIATVVAVAIAVPSLAAGVLPVDVFNNCGTLSSFGFIIIYLLISIAAGIYVKRIGAMKVKDFAISAIAVVLLVLPAIWLVLSNPAAPQKWFPIYFVAFLLSGLGMVCMERVSTAARVADLLRERISAGEIEPGARIVELDIARELSVSRSPIREALLKLSEEGLVKILPYRGAIVAALRRDHIKELLEFRLALERFALERLVAGRDRHALDMLKEHVGAIADAVAARDFRGAVNADLETHRAIVRLAGNQLLAQSYDGLLTRIRLYIRITSERYERVEDLADEHVALLDAVERGDATLAQHILDAHILHGFEEALRAVPDEATETA